MEDAALILLIVVSSALTLFLIMLCVALVYLIKFLKRADDVADSIENTATAIKRGAEAMPVIRLIAKIVNGRRK